MCRCCTLAYDFILVIVVTSLFCYSHFHTLTLLGGLYQMFLDSAAVALLLCSGETCADSELLLHRYQWCCDFVMQLSMKCG